MFVRELALDVKKLVNWRKKYDSVVENDIKLVNDNKLLEAQKKNYETALKTEKKKVKLTDYDFFGILRFALYFNFKNYFGL